MNRRGFPYGRELVVEPEVLCPPSPVVVEQKLADCR
jgi:hypothetical protein